MSIKIEDREVRIPVEELFESLDAAARKRVAMLIGADVEAWRQMAEAIINKNDIFNSEDGWWMDPRSMIEVRQKLLPLMPEVARILAEGLQKQLDAAKADEERTARWAWAMWHAHVNPDAHPWPKIPDWAPASRDEMRVRDAVPQMRDVLRELEWNDIDRGFGPSCPACDNGRDHGHAPGCKLAAALRAAESPEKEFGQ